MIHDTDPTAGLDVFYLGCFPVAKDKQAEVGIEKYAPVEGAIQIDCMGCGMKVWIGPRQQTMMKDARAFAGCPRCLAVRGAFTGGVEMRSLGGNSSSIKMFDVLSSVIENASKPKS